MPDAPDYDEKTILSSVISGDQRSFTVLVDFYWNSVYSHALAYTKSAARSQEITQDIFLKVWGKRSDLTEVREFKNFLFILSRNEIISAMRKKLMDVSGHDPLDRPEDTLIPHLQLEYKESYSRFLAAMEKLPPTRKIIFKMSRMEGLKYEEIARKMNLSKNTVKEHIVLALSFVRTYLHTHSDFLFFFLYWHLFKEN